MKYQAKTTFIHRDNRDMFVIQEVKADSYTVDYYYDLPDQPHKSVRLNGIWEETIESLVKGGYITHNAILVITPVKLPEELFEL